MKEQRVTVTLSLTFQLSNFCQEIPVDFVISQTQKVQPATFSAFSNLLLTEDGECWGQHKKFQTATGKGYD